ncbi:hypothetical protein SAV14893_018900 [Streptomyces avermitilis]|uniref:Uncharacterized protein n=1 Tax=Streptomyces avermitilis TaxID=33903 RepID=A0A4D4LWG5_STRAX|nr:hypothetical protein SAVMC3_30980 [Streptomyces avermitilis]GDY62497.1 hypothetical protein SAV14893_018900 [Streptomyces avermitilis]GDY77392.1 hypothetical protein SAV31267_068770 [Streptomyces avermitilis]GDY86288.1 hypothetical protein SAVCW2_54870 [Streptomyces avermitilis]
MVDEAEFGAEGVGEAHPDAQMPLVGTVVRLHQQLTAHSEMRQDGRVGRLQREPEVLSAAARHPDPPALQAVREVLAARGVASYGTWVQHLDIGDGAVGDPPLQASPYNLDLGQFGHDDSPTHHSARPGRGGRSVD